MNELNLLEHELVLMQNNIARLKKYISEESKTGYNYQSLVVGELKHRCVALKQRLTIINKISTKEYFKGENK